MSKEWHDKMHGHGIWHGSICRFCKPAQQKDRERRAQILKTRMNDPERLDLRSAPKQDALLAQAAKIVAKSKKEPFLADAERILAKPKQVRRKR